MTDKIVVFSACATLDEARRIANKLIEGRLAACVNVMPGVRSFYRWKGVIEEADECLLVIKSSRDLLDRLRLELEKAHSYEVPEVVAVPIVAGSPNYLNWLESELKSSSV
jgi:periplasmic divalent cation tolerance protein